MGSIRCRLGHCGRAIHDLSIKGIKDHISRPHEDMRNLRRRNGAAGRIACFWDVEGKSCGKMVTIDGLGKHLATAHLSIMRKDCQYCGRSLARIDALICHQRRDCKAISEDARMMLEFERE